MDLIVRLFLRLGAMREPPAAPQPIPVRTSERRAPRLRTSSSAAPASSAPGPHPLVRHWGRGHLSTTHIRAPSRFTPRMG